MSVVGEDFKHNVLYVPEVLIAARAMKAGMAVLKPLLSARDGGVSRIGVLLMGTVRGDLHDIGKNLVCMMAEGAGFEVHDIGVDQSVEKFMAAADKCQPTIIGMSALLTTTMTYMKTVIDGFEARRPGAHQDGGRRRAHQPDVRRRDRRRRLRPECVRRGRPVPPPVARQRDAVTDDLQDPLLAGDSLADQGRRRERRGHVILPPRFMERIDQLAAKRGLQGADDYLAQWQWSEEQQREGAAPGRRRGRTAELEAEGRLVRPRSMPRSPSTDITSTFQPGTSLFDAASQAGVRVPTSCVAQGKCKECIVEVTTRHGAAHAADGVRATPGGSLPAVVSMPARRRSRAPSTATRCAGATCASNGTRSIFPQGMSVCRSIRPSFATGSRIVDRVTGTILASPTARFMGSPWTLEPRRSSYG